MKKDIHIPGMILMLLVLAIHISYAQLDSIFDQGVYRTFIVHTPAGYDADNQYPIVFNLHGLNSNAAQEEAYSQFDVTADAQHMIVVYPNAINQSWAIGANTDVDFISHLADTVRTRYSCNDCLFFTGISDGGFMTYKLACALSKPITAIAVVSGNMAQFLENNCVIANGIPVMHFHGTADPLVNYNGTFGIPSVETTIHWWVTQDNCNSIPVYTAIPDIHMDDGCTVERYEYPDGNNGSEVIFYKIINGGHTWPGAIPVPPLGNTNQDIEASTLIGEFFHSFCSSATAVKVINSENLISIFPNPVHQILTVQLPEGFFDISLYDIFGKIIYKNENVSGTIEINCMDIPGGIYFLFLKNGSKTYIRKIMITSL